MISYFINSIKSFKPLSEINRPLLVLVSAFALGILVSNIFDLNPFFILGLAFIILFVTVGAIIKVHREVRWLLLALFFLTGVLSGGLAQRGVDISLLKYTGHHVTITGRVDQVPEHRTGYVQYVLELHKLRAGKQEIKCESRLLVRLAGNAEYGYGDVLRVEGVLHRPASTGNPGAFSYRDYLTRRGIAAIMYVEPDRVKKTSGSSLGVLQAAYAVRDNLMGINNSTLSPVNASILNGMMFGARGEIPYFLQEAFSEAGLAHVLCVSGLHLGLILGGLLLLFRFLGVPAAAVPLAVTPILFFYAAMTGFGPAVLRAMIMALLLLWGRRLGRERDWPTALALAALVILLFNPLQIYEVGFQLSFAATWGILYLGPFWRDKMARVPLPAWAKSILQVTLSAQLATLPILVQHFNLVSFISVLTNLVAVPVAGLVLLLGFTAGLVGLVIMPGAYLINAGTEVLLTLYKWLVVSAGQLPGAFTYISNWPWWGVVLWYAGLVTVVESSRRKEPLISLDRKQGIVLLLIAVSLATFFCWGKISGGNQLEMHCIDVGQGDSILLRLPAGQNLLIDTGGWRGDFQGGPGVGEYVVVPYLRRLGINSLDALILSHFHEDHAGGAAAVLRSLAVDRLIIPPGTGGGNAVAARESILDQARQMKIPIYQANAGDGLRLDPRVEITFWGPRGELYSGSRSDENNNSLVMFVDYREMEILLAGDIEEEMQSWLVREGTSLPVEVLKVPHHGSSHFSRQFINELCPDIAVISVGERNSFGLPSREMLKCLDDNGTRIYRTDRHGAIIISSDGEKYRVRTGR